ncbi:outer membrane protein assembly factor BamB family protein [Halorhabdus tiamatea]|uniref:outer membrane protein assembly factor BamB family protein n=1 Tax=Halorhabdus tiamatea TaxID=430914 RepID=UPI000212244F|nr:PQQ-binding-like beta-propeller repeat protein [Halorhabdus tiamatea]
MNRRELVLASAGALTTSLAGCGQLDGVLGGDSVDGPMVDNWGTFRGDVARTGRIAAEDGPGESVSVAWQVTIEDVVDAFEDDSSWDEAILQSDHTQPIVADDYLILMVQYQQLRDQDVGSRQLLAIDPSGSIEWTREFPRVAVLDGLRFLMPKLDDGLLYLPNPPEDYLSNEGDEDGDSNGTRKTLGVTVLDPETGDLERELDLGSPSTGSLLVEDGTIFAATFDPDHSGVSAFDAESGAEQWSVDTYPYHDSSVFGSLFADTIVYGRRTGDEVPTVLVARNIEDGSLRWETTLDFSDPYFEFAEAPLDFVPVTIVDDIYTTGSGFYSGRPTPLVALDTDEGTEQYRYRPPGIEGENNPLAESSEMSGQDIDELPPASGVYGMPLPMDDLVVATGYGAIDGNDDPDVRYCLGIEDESLAWSLEIEANDLGSPVAAGDVIYLSTETGVKAISTGGERLDSIEYEDHESVTGSGGTSVPAIGNGLLYVPTETGIAAIE